MSPKSRPRTRGRAKSSRREREPVSTAVRHLVLTEAGFKCASPVCRHILTLELHHILWVKDGGPSTVENLLALCPNCHSLHTMGHIPAESIRTWKALLQSLNNPNRASADLLLVLYKEELELQVVPEQQRIDFSFTGDGLGMLAGLLTSGLVAITHRVNGIGWMGGGMPYFHVALTDAGRELVEAWIAGSLKRSQLALADKRNGETASHLER